MHYIYSPSEDALLAPREDSSDYPEDALICSRDNLPIALAAKHAERLARINADRPDGYKISIFMLAGKSIGFWESDPYSDRDIEGVLKLILRVNQVPEPGVRKAVREAQEGFKRQAHAAAS